LGSVFVIIGMLSGMVIGTSIPKKWRW
jgi:hypothetical protein